MKKQRIIIHIDMDAFFVSVEETHKPYLKGRPVVVAGNTNIRSVVATASYEARRYGVHSAMPLFMAKKLCRNIIILKSDMKKYVAVSKRLIELYGTLCPAVEQFSIDEAFLDLTYTVKNFKEAEEFGTTLKNLIKSKFGLPATVGISYNKLLAKLASKLGKPDGLFLITQKNKDAVLQNLPVIKISGIGKKTSDLLYLNFGVTTLGELRKIPLMDLSRVFHSSAVFLHNASAGKDDSPIISDYEKPQEKSIGNSITFHSDSDDVLYIKRVFKYLAEKVGMRLRARGLFAKSIIIVIRYSDFKTVSHRKKVFAMNGNEAIYTETLALFKSVYKGGKVRLVGITASNFCKTNVLSLFDNNKDINCIRIETALDKIKLRYGDKAIDYGGVIFLKD